MKRELLQYLACPECSGALTLTVDREAAGAIETGRLTCAADGRSFPIDKFVPRFVDQDRYVASFSKQRQYVEKHFDQYITDRSGDQLFLPTTGFSADNVRNGLNLEVGCGYGRFVDTVQRMGGTIIGVDLSTDSINLAQRFVGDRPNVHLVQCDLFHLPFRRGIFDSVFSIGVLHHCPDTRGAFRSILPFAKAGGEVSIWVYHPRNKVIANRWRRLTTKLPFQMVYSWCVLNQAIASPLHHVPVVRKLASVIPASSPANNRSFWRRVLTDFDSLSPKYAHVHDEAEVRQWFEEAGLEAIKVLPRVTAVVGRVPSPAITARVLAAG